MVFLQHLVFSQFIILSVLALGLPLCVCCSVYGNSFVIISSEFIILSIQALAYLRATLLWIIHQLSLCSLESMPLSVSNLALFHKLLVTMLFGLFRYIVNFSFNCPFMKILLLSFVSSYSVLLLGWILISLLSLCHHYFESHTTVIM